MKARLLCVAAACIVVPLFVSACPRPKPTEAPPIPPVTKAPVPEGDKVIGVSLLTKQHVFYQDLEAAMREEAAKQGYTLAVVSSEFDANTQNSQVDDFIVQKVRAIVLCPADSASVGGAVKKANAAGIPVFTADIAAKEGDIVSHIASDNKQGGKLAGELIVKAIGGRGKVLVVDHPAVVSVQDRTAGFDEVMRQHPDIQVIKQPAEGQRAKAREVTENMLSANPELKAIFGINDDSALGALAACRAHKGADKVIIIGFDATPEARKEIQTGGQLKADIVQYPKKMGAKTIETVAQYLSGGEVPKSIPIEVGVVDKETLDKGDA